MELWKSLDAAAEIFALASSVLRVELRARRQTLSSESWEAHVPSARAPRRIARSKGIEDKDDSSLFRKSYNVLHCPFDIRAGAKAMFARLGTYYGLWYANVFGHMKITKKYNMETIYC